MNYLYSIITSLMIITMPINLNDTKSPKEMLTWSFTGY